MVGKLEKENMRMENSNKIDKNFYFLKKNKMNEFIFLSLENIDDILTFSRVCKKGNEIYKKWKNEWYTLHTQITEDIDEFRCERETKIIGNREYVTAWYENGNKLYEKEYKDEKLEGKWIGWYKSGTIQYEKEFKNGKLEGKCIGWYERGDKQYEEKFKNGKKEGKWIYWWKNGHIEEYEYENGKIKRDI